MVIFGEKRHSSNLFLQQFNKQEVLLDLISAWMNVTAHKGRVILFFVLLFLLTERIWLSGLCVKEGSFYSLFVLLFLLTESIWLSGLCVKEGSFNFIVCPALPYLVIL